MKQLRLNPEFFTNKNSKIIPKQEPESHNPTESAIIAAELGGLVPTIDLHGFSADQALHVMENFLFARHPAGEALRIIHGRGKQKLRGAIHKWLKNNANHIAYFRDSNKPGEQGGVTYVVMNI